MKKVFLVLFTFILLAASVLSCRAVQFTCTVPQVKSGREMEVSLSLDKNAALYAAEFELTYDPNCCEFTGQCTAGEACLSLSPVLKAAEKESGRIEIAYSATQPLNAGGTLCTLRFKATGNQPDGFSLTVNHAATVDGDSFRELPVTTNVQLCDAVDFSCSVPKAKTGKNTDLIVSVDKDSLLYTAEFVLTYDPNSYEFTHSSATGDACKGLSPLLEVAENELGRIKIVYVADQPLTAGGALCTLGFKPKRGATQGKFDLTVEHAETFDGKEIVPLLTSSGGTVGEIEKSNMTIYFAVGAAWAGAALCVLVLLKRKKEKAASK